MQMNKSLTRPYVMWKNDWLVMSVQILEFQIVAEFTVKSAAQEEVACGKNNE